MLHSKDFSSLASPNPSIGEIGLAISALEDKILQGATVMMLNTIYEGDFVGFSYGFRPGRGPHDALDALSTAIKIRKVSWILDADIQNFFGSVSQDWLARFLYRFHS
jgi:RNA-directed DNA polymerase